MQLESACFQKQPKNTSSLLLKVKYFQFTYFRLWKWLLVASRCLWRPGTREGGGLWNPPQQHRWFMVVGERSLRTPGQIGFGHKFCYKSCLNNLCFSHLTEHGDDEVGSLASSVQFSNNWIMIQQYLAAACATASESTPYDQDTSKEETSLSQQAYTLSKYV